MADVAGTRGKSAGMRPKHAEEKEVAKMQSAHHMSDKEKRGKIFTQHDKDRINKAIQIPDLAALRGDPIEREKDIRWEGAARFIKTLNKGYTLSEATEIHNLNVSPLQFAISLLESRGQKGDMEDPYLIAALFGIEFGSQAGGDNPADSGIAFGSDDEESELLSKYAHNKESLEDFRKRIQSNLHAHIQRVTALHDEVFSYKHHAFQMKAVGAAWGRCIANISTKAEKHCISWSSYQDCMVEEQSEYYQTKPWVRQTERHVEKVRDLADKLEHYRKVRALAKNAEQQLNEGIEQNTAGSYLLQLQAIYPAIGSLRAKKSPRDVMATVLQKTQMDVTKVVLDLQAGVWAVDHHRAARANKHRSQRPLSALYSASRHRNYGIEAYERYAAEMLPRFALPMSHLTTGKHPVAGIMRHTGALCPSFDQPWATAGKSYEDISAPDYEALMRANITVAKAEKSKSPREAANTKRIKAYPPEGTPTSEAQSARRRSHHLHMPRNGRRHDKNLLEHSLLQNPDNPGIDPDILHSYDAYVRKKLNIGMHLAEDAEGHGGRIAAPPSHVPDVERGEAGGHSLRGELVGSDAEFGAWIARAADKLAAGLQTAGEMRGPGGLIPAGFARISFGTSLIGISSPVFSPIFLCCPVSDLVKAVADTPTRRVCDLVVMHTGLHRSLIDSRLEKRRFQMYQKMMQAPESRPAEVFHKQQVLQWMASRKITGCQPPRSFLLHS